MGGHRRTAAAEGLPQQRKGTSAVTAIVVEAIIDTTLTTRKQEERQVINEPQDAHIEQIQSKLPNFLLFENFREEEVRAARLPILPATAEYGIDSDNDDNSKKDEDNDDLRGSIRSSESGPEWLMRILYGCVGFYHYGSDIIGIMLSLGL